MNYQFTEEEALEIAMQLTDDQVEEIAAVLRLLLDASNFAKNVVK